MESSKDFPRAMSASGVGSFAWLGKEVVFAAEFEVCWPAGVETNANSAKAANVVRVFIVVIAFRVGRALLPARLRMAFQERAIRSLQLSDKRLLYFLMEASF